MARLTIVEDEQALARQGAERLTTLIEQAIAERESAIVSLTGGDTPRLLYAYLADASRPWRQRIEWQRLHLFWGDERHVPPDHPDSNFGMAYEALIRHVPIPEAQVHRMRGELTDAAAAARHYEDELQRGFAATGRDGQTFDVMLLGLGEDAHVASIFPGSELLARTPARHVDAPSPDAAGSDPQRARAAAVYAPHLRTWRITLTPAALLDARAILLVVAGVAKAEAVRAAIEEPAAVVRYPAQLLRTADDRVEWIVDEAAAKHLAA